MNDFQSGRHWFNLFYCNCLCLIGNCPLRRVYITRNINLFRLDCWHDHRGGRRENWFSYKIIAIAKHYAICEKFKWWPTAAYEPSCCFNPWYEPICKFSNMDVWILTILDLTKLFVEPELLILDEPTVGVDPVLRQSIWDHLVHLTSTGKKTVIVTTHYIEETRQAHVVGLLIIWNFWI